MNWLKRLDQKLEPAVKRIDQTSGLVVRAMTFEVLHSVDGDKAKAARLLQIRRDAAGLDYEEPTSAPDARQNGAQRAIAESSDEARTRGARDGRSSLACQPR